jgi:KRAB domain-containing zinc finger protein
MIYRLVFKYQNLSMKITIVYFQEDLQPEPVTKSGAELNSLQDIQIVEVVSPEEWGMPLQKMRTLLALLLKKISTPGRLKKLGFGTRLIDQVLKESIEASGRKPCEEQNLSEGNLLKKNIEILLEWTIPEDYMDTFRQANKSVEEILQELAG